MRTKVIFIYGFLLIFQLGCTLKFNSSYNNVWKVPGTKLEIAVVKETSSADKKMVERTMILREDHSDKSKISLARTGNEFSRLNVYQTAENTFLIRDSFNSYELNTQTKTLQKIAAPIAASDQKFVGAFDDNQNGNWRFISASERAEIPFGANKS